MGCNAHHSDNRTLDGQVVRNVEPTAERRERNDDHFTDLGIDGIEDHARALKVDIVVRLDQEKAASVESRMAAGQLELAIDCSNEH